MIIAPPAPSKRSAHEALSKPFTTLIEKFGLETEEISVLIGLDRRTISRWAKAEAAGEESPVPSPVRHLFDIYREGYVSERLECLLWFRQIRERAEDFYPVEGEENWLLRPAESIGKDVRLGPWVTVPPLSEMVVGIRFCRARLSASDAAIRQLTGGADEKELSRVEHIAEQYRRIVDDYSRKFPEKAKRGRPPASRNVA